MLYNAAFISDIHLFFRGSDIKKLNDFLKNNTFDKIYFVGDTFDFWACKSRVHWGPEINRFFRIILKKINHGTKIVLIRGNHDDHIHHYFDIEFDNLTIVDHCIHQRKCGSGHKDYLIIHGDQFDFVIKRFLWLAQFGAIAYDFLVVLNGILSKFRDLIGLPYWSLSSWLKKKSKEAVSFIEDFEYAAVNLAKEHDCDGVICGHVHTPKFDQHMIEGRQIEYWNCGDWIESYTLIVEKSDGQLELLHLNR